MTGPKHLWAGDWEAESGAVRQGHDSLANRPAEPEPRAPEPEPEPAPVWWRPRPLAVGIGFLAALIVVGAALGLSALIGSGKSKPHTPTAAATGTPFGLPGIPPQMQTIPQASHRGGGSTVNPSNPQSPPAYGPAVYWLGMQIQATSPGIVVIDTVALGSEGDAAGLEPGEQLVSVNGHFLRSASDIAGAIGGLGAGTQINVEVSYGSSSPQSVALTLGAPPRRHP